MAQSPRLTGAVFGLFLAGFTTTVPALAGAPHPQLPAPPAEIAVENPPIFPLREVKRGLTGYGYTVFNSATGPERFGFEVLGVMRSYLGPGEDLIIAKLVGERIERTGVISGMSGSPVYVDGRLVGAVGYRFGKFTKDAIAGITPIERMLTVAEPPPASTRKRSQAVRPSPAETPWGVAEPVSVPVVATGLRPEIAKIFEKELKARHMWPVLPAAGGAGGKGSGQSSDDPTRFYASGPIAGVLVDGDLSMAGIGTVTWVKGDRFLGFGHPFQAIGQTEMPVSNAEIVTTVASPAGSWKMGQATTPVGRLTDDRLHAIAGTMGEMPSQLPVDIVMKMASPRREKDARFKLHFDVLRHPTDTPLFVAISIANSLGSRVATEVGGTMTLKGRATLSTGDVIEFERRAAGDGVSLDLAAAIGTLGELSSLTDHGIADVRLEKVDVTIERQEEVLLENIVSVAAADGLVAGEPTTVVVRSKTWEGPVVERRIPVTVPKGLTPGRYSLVAASHVHAARIEISAGQLGQRLTLPSYLKQLQRFPPPGSLSLYLLRDDEGVVTEGRSLDGTPVSFRDILEGTGGFTGKLSEASAVRVFRAQRPGVLDGRANARVYVRRQSPAEVR